MGIRVHQDGDGNPVLLVSVEGGSEYAVKLSNAEPYSAEFDEDGNELPLLSSERKYAGGYAEENDAPEPRESGAPTLGHPSNPSWRQ